MSKTLSILTIALLAAGAVSCGKAEKIPVLEDGALTLRPAVGAATKSVAEGTTLPDDFTISLGAYHVNETAPESSGNYLTGEPFTKIGSTWSATPTVYWPFGGYLKFLALASGKASLITGAVWYGADASRSVELTVPEGASYGDEIMYAGASSEGSDEKTVAMTFSHSQAWVRLRIAASESGTTRIDSIAILKAYIGGVLRVDNGVRLSAEWDFRGYLRKDYVFPASKNLVLTTDETVLDVLLPEQDACGFTIWYTQKNADEPSWDNYTRKTSFTAAAGSDPWYAGVKSVYTATVRRQVTLTGTVHGWDGVDKTVTIN